MKARCTALAAKLARLCMHCGGPLVPLKRSATSTDYVNYSKLTECSVCQDMIAAFAGRSYWTDLSGREARDRRRMGLDE